MTTSPAAEYTIGSYLAARLADVGVRHFFTVPGDFTLSLLDEFLRQPDMEMISCCNELNAGYAADGYARGTGGMAVVMVTYMVGGLSVINATAGSYSDDLPVLVISGGPNTNDAPAHHVLHHTTGEHDFYQSSRCFAPVVASVVQIRHVDTALQQIDDAVATCLNRRKPVYLEIACNLSAHRVGAPKRREWPDRRQSVNTVALDTAVEAAAERINSAVKPVLVAGAKIRPERAGNAFLKLAEALGCPVAVTPDAKGLVPEDHPAFMGTYWGEVGSPNCSEIIESSDCQIFTGPVFTDYTTVGWTTLTPPSKLVHVGRDYLKMGDQYFGGIGLEAFLSALAERVKRNETALTAYRRQFEPRAPRQPAPADEKLSVRELRRQVQDILTDATDLVVETGDAWFHGQKMRLPRGCRYFMQMQYGSIGWSVGAVLGLALAGRMDRRPVALIGDGSFQLTAQEVSTMIRYKTRPIIFLLNNGGYTIEVEIHDGPYNVIKNWNYAGLMNVLNAGDGAGLGLKASTGGELAECIAKALPHDGPVLIECTLDRDDCTSELLEWGSRVAAANGR